MARDPGTEKIHVRLADAQVLLAVVDRLAAGVGRGPEAVSLFTGDLAATMFAGTIFIFGGVHTTAPEASMNSSGSPGEWAWRANGSGDCG